MRRTFRTHDTDRIELVSSERPSHFLPTMEKSSSQSEHHLAELLTFLAEYQRDSAAVNHFSLQHSFIPGSQCEQEMFEKVLVINIAGASSYLVLGSQVSCFGNSQLNSVLFQYICKFLTSHRAHLPAVQLLAARLNLLPFFCTRPPESSPPAARRSEKEKRRCI